MLAKRYQNHPALGMWHISNEYGGECHCPLCQEAFRDWLREKYHNNIEELNHAWFTGFWSKRFSRLMKLNLLHHKENMQFMVYNLIGCGL